MNKSSIFGFAIVSAVVYMGAFHSARNPSIFMDMHAVILVIGGTFAVAFVAYPYSSLIRTVDYLIWGLLFKKKEEALKLSQEIAELRNYFNRKIVYTAPEKSHPFFRESAHFLMNKNIDTDALENILRNRSDNVKKRYKEDAKILTSLGKYPPAFGLLGASTGMIEMMQNLGTGGSAGIGQAMAVALVATFWGIAMANFIILPLADSAAKSTDEDSTLRNLIIDGMLLIRQNVTDDHFQAYLRGYLTLAERTELKIFSTQNVYTLRPAKQEKAETPEPVTTPPTVASDTFVPESKQVDTKNAAGLDFKNTRVVTGRSKNK